MTDETKAELAHLIDCVDQVYSEAISFCRTLTPEQTGLSTGCPGWSVHDQLAHMVGLEQSLVGSSEPTIDVPVFDHVRNDIGRYMESHVHARRALPFEAIIDEMAGLHPRRLAQLREQAAQGDIELTTPWGSKRSLSESLKVRVLDLWSHEQDIRLAVGAAPRTNGIDGDLAETRTLGAWQALLPRSVDGPGRIHIVFTDGNNGAVVIQLGDAVENQPMLSISGTRSVLTCLGFGRQPVSDYLSAATITGDADLRAQVIPHLGFTP